MWRRPETKSRHRPVTASGKAQMTHWPPRDPPVASTRPRNVHLNRRSRQVTTKPGRRSADYPNGMAAVPFDADQTQPKQAPFPSEKGPPCSCLNSAAGGIFIGIIPMRMGAQDQHAIIM